MIFIGPHLYGLFELTKSFSVPNFEQNDTFLTLYNPMPCSLQKTIYSGQFSLRKFLNFWFLDFFSQVFFLAPLRCEFEVNSASRGFGTCISNIVPRGYDRVVHAVRTPVENLIDFKF